MGEYNFETRHIIQNYVYLKAEMEPIELVDYLVKENILDTDENSCLMGLCRAKKCDFILRKLVRNQRTLEEFVRCLNRNFELDTLQTVQCFRYLPHPITPVLRIPQSEVQGKSDYPYSSMLYISQIIC